MDNFNKNPGFTLPEILSASLIVLLIFVALMSFYSLAQAVWIEGNARASLQRQARIAMEAMVRGVDGASGIREAGNVAIGAGDTAINFTDLSLNTRTFYFSPGQDADVSTIADNQIIYTNESAVDRAITESNVKTLTFSQPSADSVEITLSMEDTVKDKVINVDLATRIKLRN